MKLGLVFNEKNKIPENEIGKICQMLDAEVLVFQNFGNVCGVKHVSSLEQLIKSSDIILAFGGDGTILETAKFAAIYEKPVLGINTGYLGFLACIERPEISKLKKVLNSEFKVSSRMILECKFKEKSFLALNDVVLSRGAGYRVANYSVFKENFGKTFDCLADGIIAATPTGCTAYSFSAGGPILEPELETLVVTAICPHCAGVRSLILDAKSPLKINFKPKENSEVCIFADGNLQASSFEEGTAEIKKSSLKARLIYLNESNFFQQINKKLI